jgi:hypothetical protein
MTRFELVINLKTAKAAELEREAAKSLTGMQWRC